MIYRHIYIYRCIYKGKSYSFGHFVQGTVLNALYLLTNSHNKHEASYPYFTDEGTEARIS